MKMTVVVENHKMNEVRDKFPIGMRVLAVDDDRTCLKILERLLLRCQYHVTTAQNAITALNLLRKNKNNFDLVISNVHMPDMDGFKLLELVGLEMDLPVIMFSANDDQKMVMKGIEHGACDYLVKPVRLKELQIIWQHVIRKKKTSKTGNHDAPKSDSGNGIDSAVTANSDQNEKSYRKRKEHDEDDSEENEDDNDSEDPTARKKARVVWAPDLHRKFIAAVNHLGFDKAVPKKILDLMNVETLTRENVASHLQKYRLYLKKVSMENQQAHMIEALGNSAFGSHSGVGGHWQTLNDSTQFHNNPFRSSPSSSMSNRFNNPTNVNIHGLPSSGTLQLNQTLNLNKSTNDQFKFQSALTRGNPIDVQRMPISTGLDQFQYNRGISISPIQNLTNKPKVTMSFTPSSVLDISNNPMMLEPNSQNKNLASQYSQFSHPLLENKRCNDIWSSTAQLPETNYSYLPREKFGQDMHSQGVIFNNVPFQGWENHDNHDGSNHSHVIGSSIGSSMIPVNSVEPEGNLDYNYCDTLQMNQMKSHNSGISNNLGSLEDIIVDGMKQKQDKVKLMDGYYDNFSGGTSL